MAHPADVSALVELFDSGLPARDVLCVLGKTEGNGCVNDFTRGYATLAVKLALAERLGVTPDEVGRRVALIMSGGTEGVLAPHFLVFGRIAEGAPRPGVKALAIGCAFTRDFRPEELGRRAQIEATAEAVRGAMAEAAIDGPEDVHFVQIKCPLLTAGRMAEAAARGASVAVEETYASMGLSRGASALGVALALGEIASAPGDAAVCRDFSLYSTRASTSAGVELLRNEVMVLGNSAAWGGELAIVHDVMADAIDAGAFGRALASAGLDARDPASRRRVVALLAKAEPARSGRIRDERHVMLDDSDINATRHARAAVGGVLAGALGATRIYVSGGAEHQGPEGGGPLALILRRA
jgi:cyanuric acid amidohydrolase